MKVGVCDGMRHVRAGVSYHFLDENFLVACSLLLKQFQQRGPLG